MSGPSGRGKPHDHTHGTEEEGFDIGHRLYLHWAVASEAVAGTSPDYTHDGEHYNSHRHKGDKLPTMCPSTARMFIHGLGGLKCGVTPPVSLVERVVKSGSSVGWVQTTQKRSVNSGSRE